MRGETDSWATGPEYDHANEREGSLTGLPRDDVAGSSQRLRHDA